MAKSKSTHETNGSKDERERARAEIEALNRKQAAEREALYAANVPPEGDPRAEALGLAEELLNVVHACMHSVKANDADAAQAIERLRRMELAVHHVGDKKDLAPQELVRLLHAVRAFYRSSKASPIAESSAFAILRALGDEYRKRGRTWSRLGDLSDRQVRRVLEAPNFDKAMSQLLGELQIASSDKNVGRIKKKKL